MPGWRSVACGRKHVQCPRRDALWPDADAGPGWTAASGPASLACSRRPRTVASAMRVVEPSCLGIAVSMPQDPGAGRVVQEFRVPVDAGVAGGQGQRAAERTIRIGEHLANAKRWPPAPKRDSGAQSPAAHAAASSAHGINRLKVACGQGMAACRRATVAHPPSPTERTHGTGATAIGYRLAWWVPGAIAGNDRCGFSCPGTPRGFLHARPPPVRSTVIRLRGAPAVRRPTGRTPRRPAASAAHRHCRCYGPVRSRRGSGRRHGFAADRADGRRGRCRAAE